MNREQCKAILAHIDLIRHYAEGGDIGHRLINCKGENCGVTVSVKINLSGLDPRGFTNYVRLKPKYAWNPALNAYERVERVKNEKVAPGHILPCRPPIPMRKKT